ncbi:hypothetical protein HNY73_001888 [Argiope bruennichi]|uniref:Uncharacterized protein n=1 Tax=Argiope bruennichi TaxID=94029 RepID=A0A8T0FYD5_ARGBR|nr:hypothetical protein HNY73_001888 [Argiope bruennichi]
MNSKPGKGSPEMNSKPELINTMFIRHSKIYSCIFEDRSSSEMDSLYGSRVYSGAIHPISGAVPKKIHGHKRNRHHKSF